MGTQALLALLWDCSAQPGAGQGAVLLCPGAAAGEGRADPAREGGSCHAPSCNLQPWCFSNGEPAESWPGLGWQGPFKVLWTSCPTMSRAIFKQIRLLRALPDLTLNDCRAEGPSTSLGNFSQCHPTLLVKKIIPSVLSESTDPPLSLKPFPLSYCNGTCKELEFGK